MWQTRRMVRWSHSLATSRRVRRGGRIRRFWSDRLGSGGRLSIGGAVRLPLLGDDQPIISEPVGTPGRIRLFKRLAALAIEPDRLGNDPGAGASNVGIGSSACREKVCQNVYISVVAVTLKQ